MKEKELYRKKQGRWIAGVCAGMAEYMNLSVTVVRCILVAMALMGSVYVAAYLPWLLLMSVVTGLLTGGLSAGVVTLLPKGVRT